MKNAKLVAQPLAIYFKLTTDLYPKTHKEHDHIAKVPYAFGVKSLMYAMIYRRLDITQAVGIGS